MYSKLFLFFLLLPQAFWCQNPGQLDPSFDGDGKIYTTFVSSAYINWSCAVATDASRVYLAGSANDGSGTINKLSCIAFNLDGTPDNSFATNGKFQLSWSTTASAKDIEIQPDGKILLFGRDNFKLLVVRLNHDGSLDPTWSEDGIAEFDASDTDDNCCRMALQQDGKLIISGETNTINPEIFVARLDQEGLIDTSFGIAGKYSFTMPHYTGHLRNLALQSDDKIIIAFEEGIVMNNLSYLLRITADGLLDSSFNTNGYIMNSGVVGYRAIATTPDGAILVATTHNGNVIIDKFGNDGLQDNVFSATAAYQFEAKDIFLKDGKIMLVGYTKVRPFVNTVTEDYAAIAFNENGSVDSNFGTNGIAWVDMGSQYDTALQGAIQSDGKILITGNYGWNGQFVACRLIGPASLGATTIGKSNVGLYPNPTFDSKFNIGLGQKYSHVFVSISNTLGQEVQAQDYYDCDSIEMKIKEIGFFLVTIAADDQIPVTFKLINK